MSMLATVLLTLAVAVVCLALGVTCLTYGWCLVSLCREALPAFAEPCRSAWPGCLARGVATGLCSQIFMLLTYPLGLFTATDPTPVSLGGRAVVVCLHGLYHAPVAFVRLRPALRRAGLSRIVCPAYRSLGSDFETEARRLVAQINRAVPAGTPLLFLGHSLGGLFIRRLLAEPDIARRTRAVVTLGTPYRGSRLAALAIGRLGRSLRPSSPLWERLAALAEPDGVPRLALASPVDNMVIPLASLVPDRPGWRQEACRPVSHVAMLYEGTVIDRAVAFLRSQAGA